MSKPTVLVALSGGIDSAVTATLLKQQGYNLIAAHMTFWADDSVSSDIAEDQLKKLPQNKCCSVEALEDARNMANFLGMPFYVLNFKEYFKEKIVDPYLKAYESGRTPNPCVQCNKYVKFGALLHKMQALGADYVATGHYAKVTRHEMQRDTSYQLHRGNDMVKDQSYFLYSLTQEKLRHIMFPVGGYVKSEVVELAKQFAIPMRKKKESQGICFVPEKEPGSFLKRHLAETAFQSGTIKDRSGKVYGEHQGLPLYTIGQRKGIAVGGTTTPLYVIDLDYQTNTLVVGRDDETTRSTLTASNLNFISGTHPQGEVEIQARIRHRSTPQPATLVMDGSEAIVTFHQPIRAITPGQAVVFYQEDVVLGGGIIEKAH